MNIPIVYEDNFLVIVDKPAGLIVIPSPRNEKRTLTSILNDDLKERNLPYRLHPAHRLDRETSGLIIYAKGKSSQDKMMELFKSRLIKKKYIAFVQGHISQLAGEINIPILGMKSLTLFRVLETRKLFTVVEVSTLTGRKNQIRIHFKMISHPLVGETKFAFRKDFSLKAKRTMLHSSELEFISPFTKEKIHVKCDLASDMKKFLNTHSN